MATKPSDTRRRRIVTGSGKAEVQQRIIALAKEIQKRQKKIEELQFEVQEKSTEMAQLMVQHNLHTVAVDEKHVVQLEEPVGRSTREIDPEKLYELLPLKEFFRCVKVQVTKLKAFLSQAEIDRISVIKPGKKQPPRAVIRTSE